MQETRYTQSDRDYDTVAAKEPERAATAWEKASGLLAEELHATASVVGELERRTKPVRRSSENVPTESLERPQPLCSPAVAYLQEQTELVGSLRVRLARVLEELDV